MKPIPIHDFSFQLKLEFLIKMRNLTVRLTGFMYVPIFYSARKNQMVLNITKLSKVKFGFEAELI